MSIEKKSLISNRSASKKAIATKPGVSAVAPTRMKGNPTRLGGVTPARLGGVTPARLKF